MSEQDRPAFRLITDEPPAQQRDDRAEAERLQEELRLVHRELNWISRDRDALAGAWLAPFTRDPDGAKAELRGRALKVRRQLGRLKRRYQRNEISRAQLLRGIARVGYHNSLEPMVDWSKEMRGLQKRAGRSSFSGDKPLRHALNNQDYERALLWQRILGVGRDHSEPFQVTSKRLAVLRGEISENLEVSTRLADIAAQHARALPDVNGRAKELSGWIPRIPGPVTPIEPAADNLVLHMVKESRPYFSNGFTSRSHENFKAEVRAGIDAVVLTEPGFPRSVVGDDFEPVEVFEGIVHHRLDVGIDYSRVPADRWLQDFAWLAYQKVKEIRPAVIHVSSGRRGYETALVALAIQRKTGIPVVYEVRSFFEGNWTGETAMEERSEIFRRRMAVETMCMQEAAAVLTLGTSMRDELASRGVPKERIGLVPNCVNLENFVAEPVDPALQERYGITMPTFGYVSNMDHRREGQEYLIRAAQMLKAKGVEAQCVLVGGGRRLDEMKSLAQKLDVMDRVVFTGHIDHSEVSGHYSLIDVFVVPRTYERAARYVTPLKPFEAMAMGRPLLVSSVPALAEIVEAPARGEVFEPENAASLAEAVEALLADPERRAELARAGRRWVEEERQWKHNGPRYKAVFDEALAAAREHREADAAGSQADQTDIDIEGD